MLLGSGENIRKVHLEEGGDNVRRVCVDDAEQVERVDGGFLAVRWDG